MLDSLHLYLNLFISLLALFDHISLRLSILILPLLKFDFLDYSRSDLAPCLIPLIALSGRQGLQVFPHDRLRDLPIYDILAIEYFKPNSLFRFGLLDLYLNISLTQARTENALAILVLAPAPADAAATERVKAPGEDAANVSELVPENDEQEDVDNKQKHADDDGDQIFGRHLRGLI